MSLERNEKVSMISLSGKDYNLYCNGDGDYRRKKFYFLTTDNSVRSPLAISGESLIKHKKELSNSSSIINSHQKNFSCETNFSNMLIREKERPSIQINPRKELRQCNLSSLVIDPKKTKIMNDNSDYNPERKGNKFDLDEFVKRNYIVNKKDNSDLNKKVINISEITKRDYDSVDKSKYQGYPFPGPNYVRNFLFVHNMKNEKEAKIKYFKLEKCISDEFVKINKEIEEKYDLKLD